MIGKLVKRAHIGGANVDKLASRQILGENIVENTGIIKIFRYSYLKLPAYAARLPEAGFAEQHQRRAYNDRSRRAEK